MSNPLLRELFGQNRDELWRQLATEMDANYVEGDFWKHGKVQASHAGWLITLEKHGKQPARLRAPFLNPGGFRFVVYRKGVFSDLGKFMGMQDVEVGYPEFDRDFIIKGTDMAKLRQFFGNTRIRELIRAQPRVHFEVRDNLGFFERATSVEQGPEELDVLEFTIDGWSENKEDLRHLFDLFAETLDELCRIGTARSAQIQ